MKYASDFRKSAREALRGRWGIAVVAGLIMNVVGAGVASVSSIFGSVAEIIVDFITDNDIIDKDSFFPESGWLDEIYNEIAEALELIMPFIIGFTIVASVVALAVSAARFIASSIMGVGYAKFNLDHIDGEKVSLVTIFKAFKDFARPVIANLWMLLFITVGFICFVIPGIVLSFNYAMVPYILAENKEISGRDALRASTELMRGNRWRLLCLELSFIGWRLLSILTFGILNLWINPYLSMACADFYREISGTRRIAAEFSVEQDEVQI